MCDHLLVYMYSVCLCNCVILALFPNVVEIVCKTYYRNKQNNFQFVFFSNCLKYLLVFFLLMCNKLVIFFENTIISEGIYFFYFQSFSSLFNNTILTSKFVIIFHYFRGFLLFVNSEIFLHVPSLLGCVVK